MYSADYQLARSIQKTKEILNWDQFELLSFMGIESPSLHITDRLPLWVADRLTKKLNLDFENFILGNIDWVTLREHFQGNASCLPNRYSAYKQSKIRTLDNVLNLLSLKDRYTIIKKLQLNEFIFTQKDTAISGLALLDIFKEIRKLNYSSEAFKNIGFNCSQSYKPVLVSQNLHENSQAKVIYETTLNNLSEVVEKNLNYQITTLSADSLLMTVSTRQELQDSLKIKNFGSPEHCLNIWGWNMGILNFMKNKPAVVKKHSCVHQGDPHCKYEIDYSHAH